MQVMKRGRENMWFALIWLLILTLNTGWYIWGNILYYQNWQTCSCVSDIEPVGINPGVTSAVRFMIFIGYITFCKCFFLTCCLAIGIPCLCYHYRSAQEPEWSGAAPDLLKRLAKVKFDDDGSDPESNVKKECVICADDFVRGENITVLPCNDNHRYHEKCIKSWLEKKNSCPECRTEITKESLAA